MGLYVLLVGKPHRGEENRGGGNTGGSQRIGVFSHRRSKCLKEKNNNQPLPTLPPHRKQNTRVDTARKKVYNKGCREGV